ncbi:MAG: hypothetical protein ACRDUW_08110, partial [Pseudonocardiaceae bacterium]
TIYGEPDILTGKRDRINAGGFDSEDSAWASALRKHAEIDRGRKVKPSTRTVEQFLTEWLGSVKHSLKPSAYENYSTNVAAYIIPKIGHRKLQDISVPVLNAFYVHLRRRCMGLPGLNPAEHASLPRERRRGRSIPQPWSVEELAQWLRRAQEDRFAGMWVLAATTGMRRSELLGVRRDSLDLGAGTLTIDETLISVAGRAEESDGKTEAGVRTVSLDAFTIAALRRHLAMLDVERQGPAYAAGAGCSSGRTGSGRTPTP